MLAAGTFPPAPDSGISRRAFVAGALSLMPGISALGAVGRAAPRVRLTGVELLPVRASARTVWLIVRLRTDVGLTGLGEASDAFGFANTTSRDVAVMRSELETFFALVEGRSPLDVEWYRQQGASLLARHGLPSATAFSAIEQAMWDLAGKVLEVPTHVLFGGKVRDTLPVYANVNRATAPRTPAGFAAAAVAAARDGFRAIKAAPWDGFPPQGSSQAAVDGAVEAGIAAVKAMRDAVGRDVELMVDCHSFFTVPLAIDVAKRLEPQQLAWYEEPLPPERVDDTVAIRRAIRQPMAGGEILYGVSGFTQLCRQHAVDVIMPDVKHCGGLLELTHIAAMAGADGVLVAPHNPSGPVSTAASVQVCAGIRNMRLLEYQWGEAAWRRDILQPAEEFLGGTIRVPDGPGFGVELDDDVVRAHLMT